MLRRIAATVAAALVTVTSGSSSRAVVAPRSGLVHLAGHAFADDGGPYLAIGASLFWGGWGCLHDAERFDRNLAFLSGKVDFIRVLAVVGPRGWRDRTTSSADLEKVVECVTDRAYQHGLRTEWTVFGSVDTASTPGDRESVIRRFASVIRSRAEKVQFVEVANEAWQNGFSGDAGRQEARALARLLRQLTPIAGIAITAPQPGDESADAKRWYGGSEATLVTVHPDRSQRGDGGMWRPARQACHVHEWTTMPWVANEPIGPQSSVGEDDDPQRLTMAAGLTWLCGGASYTLHSGAGVRGGGAEDRERGRVANLWEASHIEQTLAGINALRNVLPSDLPNFRRQDSAGAYGASADDGRFVLMSLRAIESVPLTVSTSTRLTIFDPLSGARSAVRDLDAGATVMLPQRDAVVVIGQRHSR